LLNVESGTVTLGGDLTLDGGGNGNIVRVSSGGEMVLQNNAIVTGSGKDSENAGVLVNGGHFTMNDGKVWGNGMDGVYAKSNGRFDMEGGAIGANARYGVKWAEILDIWNGTNTPYATINKTGGIVYGTSSSDPEAVNGGGSFDVDAATYGDGNDYSVTP
jgi:hypothetical protein